MNVLPMLSLLLASLFNQFCAVYRVFSLVPLPGQQELSRVINFSNVLEGKRRSRCLKVFHSLRGVSSTTKRIMSHYPTCFSSSSSNGHWGRLIWIKYPGDGHRICVGLLIVFNPHAFHHTIKAYRVTNLFEFVLGIHEAFCMWIFEGKS